MRNIVIFYSNDKSIESEVSKEYMFHYIREKLNDEGNKELEFRETLKEKVLTFADDTTVKLIPFDERARGLNCGEVYIDESILKKDGGKEAIEDLYSIVSINRMFQDCKETEELLNFYTLKDGQLYIKN